MIKYNNLNTKIIYGNEYNSDEPFIEPKNGKFILTDIAIGITINNKGVINFEKNMNIGNYNIIVTYIIGDINTSVLYNIIIQPTINYILLKNTNFNDIFNFSFINSSQKPIVNFPNGIFISDEIDNNFIINKNTGIITINNLKPSIYNFKINYIVNSIIANTTYLLKIEPYIEYKNNNKIIYKNKFKSEIPIVKPPGGLFTLNKTLHNFIILENGIISIDDILEVGNYEIQINYTFNNINTVFNYLITIIPDIYYQPLELYYQETKIHKPINNNFIGGNFESNELLILNNGDIIIENNDIGKYSYNIIYKINNVIIELNFLLNIKPKIIYDENNIIIYKNQSEIKPICNYILNNSYFELRYINKLVPITYKILDKNDPILQAHNITINEKTGIISISENIEPDTYSVEVIYNYEYGLIISKILINIIPELYYEENELNIIINSANQQILSKPPIFNPIGGIFDIILNENNNIKISSNGILIFNNLTVGRYNIIINYTYNNIIKSYVFNLNIFPAFSYFTNLLVLDHSDIGVSELPIVIPLNGNFTIDNEINGIIIDKYSGKIYCDIINIGLYELNISYKLNDISTTIKYNIQINLKIEATNNLLNLKINYNETYNICKPIVKPLNGIFILLDKTSGKNLINTNIILNNDGSIKILENLKINNYCLELCYILNNYKKSIIYNLKIIPTIYYDISNIMINFKSIAFSCLPTINYITNNYYFKSDCNIDSKTGQLSFNELNIGKYNFNIDYIYESKLELKKSEWIIIKTIYSLQVIPVFFYIENNKYMNYIEKNSLYLIDGILSVKPHVSPIGLIFKCNNLPNDVYLDKITGIITIKNCFVGKYDLIIFYENIKTIYNLIVKPILNYSEVHININYGNIKILYPIFSPISGIFTSKLIPSNIYLDENSGIINISDLLTSGKYLFEIIYKVNNIETSIEIDITINSIFNYPKENMIINYGTNSNSGIPSVFPEGGNFYCDNLLKIELDVNNGIINFNNIDIGSYCFDIIYKINNKIDKIIYNLLVNPIFYYPKKIRRLYYKTINYSEFPITNINNGIYEILTLKYNNISIDKNNGIIKFNNLLEIGNYSIIIKFTINNITVNTTYEFEVIPLLFYENVIFNYGTTNIIEPFIEPKNGFFSIENSINNIMIDDLGVININNKINVDKYKLFIKYTLNNISVVCSMIIIIKPIIKYNKSLKLILSHNNGLFLVNNNKNIIKIKNGIIIINKYKIGIFNIEINYIVNNISKKIKLKFNIKPVIIYLLADSIIKPNINIGSFSCNNLLPKSNIDNNTGIISFDKNIIGKFNLNIICEINNIKINISYLLINEPTIYYPINNLIVNFGDIIYSCIPIINSSCGTFKIKNEIKEITLLNNGVIKFNMLVPGFYNIEIEYTLNCISKNTIFIITVNPTLKYAENIITINQGTNYIIKKPDAKPLNGIFSVNILSSDENNLSIFINNIGEINISDNIEYNTYVLNIYYIVNKQISIFKYTINIIPLFYYQCKEIKINYGEIINSEKPIISSYNGSFYLEKNYEGIIINNFNGILSFNKESKIEIGIYLIKIIYITTLLNNNKLEYTYCLQVNPFYYYKKNKKNILYNDNLIFKSGLPFIYPENGIYTNISLIQTNCIINENTGEIIINNLNIGNYIFLFQYNINNICLQTEYTITITPTINYDIQSLTLKYDISYEFDKPKVNPQGGYFSSESLPNGCKLDRNNGVLSLNKKNKLIKKTIFDKKSYNIIINYTIDNISSSTIIFINII